MSHCEWKPIEEAPRDGTKVLGYSREFGQRETFMTKFEKGSQGYAIWENGDGPVNSGWDWSEPRNGWSLTWFPTHWMPLPPPPEG